MAGHADNIAVSGRKRRIEYAVLDDGSMPAREFIESRLSKKARTRILAQFKHIADSGEINVSDQIFKHERDEISAFKLKYRGQLLRFPCFRIDHRWIVTHGFPKIISKSKWPEQQFTRANEIRDIVIQRESQSG